MLFTDLSISTYFLTPQANPSSLPPINWSTKPKKTQHDKGTLDGSQGLDPTAPADSATDGSGKQLALLSRHLGLRHSVGVVDVSSQQDGSDFRGVEFSTSVNNPIPIVYEYQDGIRPQNKPSELDLTAALSRLSTSDAPVLLEPRAPPGCPSNFSTSPFLNAYKYYVIIKGKCTGIYYGEWSDVKTLTDGVSGSIYKSFKTLEQASAFYLQAKNKGRVGCVCNPGDAARFGPNEDAVQ